MAKILIVDDSDVLRMELSEVLKGGGHNVIEASHGAEGLSVADGNPDVELVIADYNMPEMDGVTMCRRIRELPGRGSVPFFVLTTESSPELKAAGKEVGVVLWIIKPFNGEKVLAAIKKVLKLP